MLHPRLTPVGSSTPTWLASIGPTGAWGDLSYINRWGPGACGMFEVQFSMPLPPDFSHDLLRRGTLVELMDGSWRVGSPLILTEPAVGSGFGDPWKFTANGIGREVEGESSFYCLDGSMDATNDPTVAIDQAIARPNGLRWGGRDASVPAGAFGAESPLQSVGTLLGSVGNFYTKRWGVGQDNLVRLMDDPTTPEFHVVPGAAALGTADDDYATVVLVRYLDSGSSTFQTVFAPPTASAVEDRFGRREFPVDLTSFGVDIGPVSAATAQAMADGILAKSKGRLGWSNGLPLTSNEILTSGGVPADLSMVAEAVGRGTMVRLHGIFDDLLETTGNTFLDILIGEARLTDGAQTIDLNPLGLAPRDLAAVVEAVAGKAAA